MENYIKESKGGFAIDRIPTHFFAANEIDLLLKLLTYTLFERFKYHCCMAIHQSFTIQRFLRTCFNCRCPACPSNDIEAECALPKPVVGMATHETTIEGFHDP